MAELQGWRLSKAKYAQDAFNGEGPRIYGGRWNPVGVPVFYSSLSLSLAVLEVLVHMRGQAQPNDYEFVEVDFGIEETEAERVEPATLPRGWMTIDSPALQEYGRAWAAAKRSLVLLVPSVIVPTEWNAVFNPLHPQARDITVQPPKPFYFDERLFLPHS